MPMSPTTAMRWGPRSSIAIGFTTLVGLTAFGWPLIAQPSSAAVAHAADAPWLFAVLMPLLLLVVLACVHDDAQAFGATAKAIALLGVLSAVAGLIVAIRSSSWPTFSTRYERGDRTPRDAWEALDRGVDPTVDQ